MDFLYEPTAKRGILNLGREYRPPEKFRHGEWELVADMKKAPEDGDGQSVKVFECRMPARFFKLEAMADANSMGEAQAPFVVTTGSGDEMAHLIGELAKAVTQGMIGFKTPNAEFSGAAASSPRPLE
jgi:hypothetical protein